MAKLRMKLDQFSKNVASLRCVQQEGLDPVLNPSGRHDYGQMSVVISDEEEASKMVVGNFYNVEITEADTEKVEKED